jgi:hypothetical protein
MSDGRDTVMYSGLTDEKGWFDIEASQVMEYQGMVEHYGGHMRVQADGYATWEGERYSSPTFEEPNIILFDSIYFVKDQICTVILPVKPDETAGRYYRLSHIDGDSLAFVREQRPQACVPYVFVPDSTFCIAIPDYGDLPAVYTEDKTIEGVVIEACFHSWEYEPGVNCFWSEMNITSDCYPQKYFFEKRYGAFRALIIVNHLLMEGQHNPKGLKYNAVKLIEDTCASLPVSPSLSYPNAPVYDLQGRRLTRQPAKGVYIQDGKKRVR